MAALLCVSYAQAEDLTTLSGKTYKNAQVTRATSESVTVKHSAGIATVAAADLPDDMRTKYCPEPSTNAVVQQKADWDFYILGSVRHVLPDGIRMDAGVISRADCQTRAAIQRQKAESDRRREAAQRRERENPPPQKPRQYMGNNYREFALINDYQHRVEDENPNMPYPHDEECVVLGPGPGLVDNDTWKGVAYACGTYQYGSKTLRCYALTKEAAQARLKPPAQSAAAQAP